MRYALAAVLGLSLVAFAPTTAFAQDDINSKLVKLEFEQADVREVLKALFKPLNISYSVDNDVQGIVTVNLINVTFETALQNITRQVDATYRVEGGVFRIIKKEAPGAVTPGVDGDNGAPAKQEGKELPNRIKIRFMDPMVLAMMLSQQYPQNYSGNPEYSTIIRTGGGGMGGGMGMGGMGGGMGMGGMGMGGGGMMGGGMGMGGGGMMGGGGGMGMGGGRGGFR
jgi:type II secretory pathway component GspD/PulD (secretin)